MRGINTSGVAGRDLWYPTSGKTGQIFGMAKLYRRIDMKFVFTLALVLSALTAFAAPDDDYSTSVHVKKSYLTEDGGHLYQRLEVVIDGHNYELGGAPVPSSIFSAAILLPGDYKARIVKKEQTVPYKMLVVYELKFSDGKTDRFTVIGVTE
jgi:hypothetical protein